MSNDAPLIIPPPDLAMNRGRSGLLHPVAVLVIGGLNGLVAAWNHRTGQPHGVTHAALRKECGGPAAAVASAAQLQERIDRIRVWATGRA